MSNQFSFLQNWVTGLVDMGETLHILYLDVNETFDSMPHDILLNKLGKYDLQETILRHIYNWLENHTKSGVNSLLSNWKDMLSEILEVVFQRYPLWYFSIFSLMIYVKGLRNHILSVQSIPT